MARKNFIVDDRFSFSLFKRASKHDDSFVYYARLIEKSTGTILAQRSTGTDDERKAASVAGQFLVGLPLEKLSKAKVGKNQEGFEATERLRNMDLASFFTWFWAPSDSDYIRDRVDAVNQFAIIYGDRVPLLFCRLRKNCYRLGESQNCVAFF